MDEFEKNMVKANKQMWRDGHHGAVWARLYDLSLRNPEGQWPAFAARLVLQYHLPHSCNVVLQAKWELQGNTAWHCSTCDNHIEQESIVVLRITADGLPKLRWSEINACPSRLGFKCFPRLVFINSHRPRRIVSGLLCSVSLNVSSQVAPQQCVTLSSTRIQEMKEKKFVATVYLLEEEKVRAEIIPGVSVVVACEANGKATFDPAIVTKDAECMDACMIVLK